MAISHTVTLEFKKQQPYSVGIQHGIPKRPFLHGTQQHVHMKQLLGEFNMEPLRRPFFKERNRAIASFSVSFHKLGEY